MLLREKRCGGREIMKKFTKEVMFKLTVNKEKELIK